MAVACTSMVALHAQAWWLCLTSIWWLCMHHGCCVQEEQQRMQELLGHVNNALVTRVLQAMAEGNAQAIGWV